MQSTTAEWAVDWLGIPVFEFDYILVHALPLRGCRLLTVSFFTLYSRVFVFPQWIKAQEDQNLLHWADLCPRVRW